jgi:hypothetical protein
MRLGCLHNQSVGVSQVHETVSWMMRICLQHPLSRGGHNWKGGRTVEGSRLLDVMKLARTGYLSELTFGGWQWTRGDETTASIQITGARDTVTLNYRVRRGEDDWESVRQRVPIRWTPCRFGGERPWFVCDVTANGVYCGRQVTKLYGAGRLFACRHCYRLGYSVQRGGPMDCAHRRLRRLHRKLGADYVRPDAGPPANLDFSNASWSGW